MRVTVEANLAHDVIVKTILSWLNIRWFKGWDMQTDLSMLDRFYYRLQAQHACFAWVLEKIIGSPGPVFELGLGKGRTYDHLRRNLPGRDIYVFERDVRPIAECMPPSDFLVRGEIAETLPVYAQRFAGKVILAHSDVGDFAAEHNRAMGGLIAKILPPALAPGGYVFSDLDLGLPQFEAVPLPGGARESRYFIYRKPAIAKFETGNPAIPGPLEGPPDFGRRGPA